MARRAAQECGKRGAKARVALALAVVEVERRRVAEEALDAGTEQLQRQQVRRGLADAEVDGAALRCAVERGRAAHGRRASAGTRRNTASGRPSRYAVMLAAEMRRRSSKAVSE